MKLNLNAKEFLALYNCLHERFRQEQGVTGDDAHLTQVYSRLRSMIVSGLSGQVPAPEDLWLEAQAKKIEDLNKQNDKVKLQGQVLASGHIMTLDDVKDDQPEPREYPQKSSSPFNKHRHRHGHK